MNSSTFELNPSGNTGFDYRVKKKKKKKKKKNSVNEDA